MSWARLIVPQREGFQRVSPDAVQRAEKAMKRAVLACAAAVIAGAALYASGHAMDAYVAFVWLEDIHGETALNWVKQQNAATLGKLKSDPEYVADYTSLLQMLDSVDRIPVW